MNPIKIQPVGNPEITPDQEKLIQDNASSRTTHLPSGPKLKKETEQNIQNAKSKLNTTKDEQQDSTLSAGKKETLKKTASLRQEEYLKEVQQATNDLLAQLNIQLDFKVDKKLNEVVVKVKNKESGEVIRQVPPEFMLKIAKHMEEMSGLLLDTWD